MQETSPTSTPEHAIADAAAILKCESDFREANMMAHWLDVARMALDQLDHFYSTLGDNPITPHADQAASTHDLQAQILQITGALALRMVVVADALTSSQNSPLSASTPSAPTQAPTRSPITPSIPATKSAAPSSSTLLGIEKLARRRQQHRSDASPISSPSPAPPLH